MNVLLLSFARDSYKSTRMARHSGSIEVGGAGGGNVVVDVAGSPFGAGFKFNTLPVGGMTFEAGHAVRVQSFSEIQLVPAEGKTLMLSTTGALPAATQSLRGALFVVRGASGVADTLQICLKSSADSYSWKILATG